MGGSAGQTPPGFVELTKNHPFLQLRTRAAWPGLPKRLCQGKGPACLCPVQSSPRARPRGSQDSPSVPAARPNPMNILRKVPSRVHAAQLDPLSLRCLLPLPDLQFHSIAKPAHLRAVLVGKYKQVKPCPSSAPSTSMGRSLRSDPRTA